METFILALIKQYGVWTLVGILIPILTSFILPRKSTISYGVLINKFLGKILFQKKLKGKVPEDILSKIRASIQSTFQDLSFGIYLDALNLTETAKQKKIDEYLAGGK